MSTTPTPSGRPTAPRGSEPFIVIAFGLALCAMLVGCEPNPPLPGYEPNPDWVAVGADPDSIRDVPEHPGARAPVNHVILSLTEGEPRSSAERVASDLGGELVGWMEDMGAYQLRVPTSTMVELRSAIETVRADPSVASAGYDFVPQLDACPAPSDVSELERPDSCAWETMGFEHALTIFEELDLPTSPVTVAMVDSGIAASNGAFDDVRLANLNRPGGEASGLRDWSPIHHGSAVGGVIGADDGDSGVNGIASRFLKRDLTLASAGLYDQENQEGVAFLATVLARRGIAAGARIVNLSLTFPMAAPLSDDEEAIITHFRQLFERHPDVLFVCSAGNESTENDGTNHAPGGIYAPNAITVASSMPCDRTTYAPHSNYGVVDMVAQGEAVPVVSGSGGLDYKNGTSFAAPQVASAAAILASLEPELAPADLRDYLIGHGADGPAGHPSLDLGASMLQLLLDAGLADARTVDDDSDGGADPAVEVMNRVCGWSEYQVNGEGAFSYRALAEEGEDVNVTATLGSAPSTVMGETVPEEVSGFLYLVLSRPGSDTLVVQCADCGLDFASRPISPDGPASVAFTTGLQPGSLSPDPTYGVVGEGIGGELQIIDCTVIDRSSGGVPRNVLLDVRMRGQMELGTTDEWATEETRMSGFSASLVQIPTSVVVPDASDPLVRTLEARCDD